VLDVLAFLAAPFAASLVLVVILGYLGLHVLEREIIFVDLALAQIAALGAVVGLVFGHEPGSAASTAYALGATAIGAAVFSFTRTRASGVPQEALIGISYVVASAATILVADRAPEGAEHIKELLAGGIVWVTWPTVLKTLVVCAAVGAFHYACRRRFLAISEDADGAAAAGIRVRTWDFLFYLSFGVVITVAVEIAGVLMVFAYLVAPAIVALASSRRWGRRLLVAWGVGAGSTAAGLLASYRWDYPSGPAVVCALGIALLLFGGWRRWSRREVV
jgi:zinc/manganese transport system permease protein